MGKKRIATHPQSEAEKKKIGESPLMEVPCFSDPEHRARYRQLMDQCFVEGCLIDWLTLERIGLADEI